MPALSNPRHELFAQVLAAGCSATEAYVKAGYRLNKGNAGRLKTNENIRKRVEELQARNVAAQQAAMGITIGQLEKRSIGLGPEHDWSSHAADAFGYMAIAYEEPPANSRRIRRPPPPRIGTHWSD